jgi:hypothetical protein
MPQPEEDRRHYDPMLVEGGRRARNTSKYAGGNGALDGFYMNDRPGGLGGPTQGYADGLEMTRAFTGYHPQQRYFRRYDGLRQRNPHELRPLNRESQVQEVRATVGGFRTNGKKAQLANYHAIAVADGGFHRPHLPDDMRRVDLRFVQRDMGVDTTDTEAPPRDYMATFPARDVRGTTGNGVFGRSRYADGSSSFSM